MASWLDLITNAAREIGVADAVNPLSGEDAALGLSKANRLLDRWNAQRRAVYADLISPFTLSPSTSPHTIGPSGATWTLSPNRPIDIVAINWKDTSSISTPVTKRDRDWYMAQPNKTQTMAFPTDFYYEPAWANGKVWFWPVPTTAYAVDLLSRVQLAAATLDGTFSLPPGYEDAITLTLAEDFITPFGAKDVPALLHIRAREARAVVFDNNDLIPRIATRDSGMPCEGGRSDSYDYRIGPLLS